jgi:hypothetical protein
MTTPVDLVEELEARLLPQFVAAEAAQFFGGLATDRSPLLGEADRLCAEHIEMLRELERLLGVARETGDGPDFARGLAAFQEQLCTHEARERALLRRFLAGEG